MVIADAVRLLGWGRQWHELAEMIARLSERPAPSEIRRILRTYREQIDAIVSRRATSSRQALCIKNRNPRSARAGGALRGGPS